MRIDVAVIESDPLSRLGLVAAVQDDPRLRVCAAGPDADTALRGDVHPAVVVRGFRGRLSRDQGLVPSLQAIREHYPTGPIVLLTEGLLNRARQTLDEAGVGDGVIVLEESASPEVIARTVLRAAISFDRGRFDRYRVMPNAGVERLTPREWEVVRLLGHRWESREIAEDLGIAYSTVRSHLRSIYAKFGVTNRREAVREAARVVREWMLTDDGPHSSGPRQLPVADVRSSHERRPARVASWEKKRALAGERASREKV